MPEDATVTADNPEQLFAAAVAAHAAGRLADAVAGYRRVLDALPDAAAVYVNLGMALQGLGDNGAAIRACRQAVVLDPALAAAHCILGDTLNAGGRSDETLAAYGRAVALAPDFPDAHNNLGNVLSAQGRYAEAAVALRRAVILAPDQPQPYNNCGAALVKLGAYEVAALACRRALLLAPVNAEAENNLGNALVELGRTDEAVAAFDRALRLLPDFVEAAANLSGALIDLSETGAATAVCRQALSASPGYAGAYNNLANALKAEGRLAESARTFERALRVDPADAQTHFNYAAVLLKQGELRRGWQEYEWRRRTPAALARRPRFAQPEWDGRPLAGRTLLLYAEQGFGDALQFSRYAAVVAARGERVVLQVYRPLLRLMGSLRGVAEVVAFEDPLPAFDYHLPLMSAPHVFGTELATIPADGRYLHPDPSASAAWARRLPGCVGPKVGLVWAGDPRPHRRLAHLMDRQRSISLAQLAPLAAVAGVTFVNLQMGDAAAQVATPPVGLRLFDPTAQLGDFADTAALVANLDLVISVDTSVAHLAGALGRPVWILSRFDGCWRWLTGREDSPWYPTARLFRQTSPGDWGPVLERLADDLAAWSRR